MKTQKNKLIFKKDDVVELNETQLLEVDGGTTPACVTLVAVFIASMAFSYMYGQDNKTK